MDIAKLITMDMDEEFYKTDCPYTTKSVFLLECREYHNIVQNKFRYQEGSRYWKRLVKPRCGNFMFRGWQQA